MSRSGRGRNQQELEALLDEARALDSAALTAFLDAACAENPALREEVETLLAAEAKWVDDSISETASWDDDLYGGQPRQNEIARLLRQATRAATKASGSEDLVGRQLGPYVLGHRVGEGGMGVVYEAHDRRLGRRVAIKVLPPWLRDEVDKKRFIREARAASAFDHPNICTVYDIGESDAGRLYMVLAFYAGETLDAKLKRGALPVAMAIEIASQVGEGLARAHEAGVTHRDIKPANIMITNEGIAKILDFGIASVAGDLGLTDTGAAIGTPSYMAPEQARGEPVDARADVWALGALLYEMLSGHQPFEAENQIALLHKILETEPEPLARLRDSLSGSVVQTIERALTKSLDRRTPTISAFLDDLEGEANPPLSSGSPRRLRRWAIAIAIATGLGFGLWRLNVVTNNQTPNVVVESARLEPLLPAQLTPSLLRIAILPFQHVGADENAFFATGLTEEITRRLASLNGLAVVSRTSAARALASASTLRDVGAQLDVAYVLEGTVNWPPRNAGVERIRITPRLVRIADLTDIWSDAYDREPANVLNAQSDIALEVATQLEVNLAQSERRTLEATLTPIPAAYLAYLRGLELSRHTTFDLAEVNQSVLMFDRAVAEDPHFVEAWAQLVRAHARLYFNGNATDQRRNLARAALNRALAIEPDGSSVRLAEAYYRYHIEGDHDGAADSFAAVALVRPHHAEVLTGLGYVERRRGNLDQAITLLERAFSYDPSNAILAENIGETYMAMRRHAETERWLTLALEKEPDRVFSLGQRALNMLAWKGCPETISEVARCSTVEAQRILDQSPIRDDPRLLYYRVLLDLYRATISTRPDQDPWREALDRLRAVPESSRGEARLLLFWREVLILRHFGLEIQAQVLAENSRQILDRLTQSAPEFALFHANLGVALALLGHRQGAIAAGERGVALAKSDLYGGPRQRELLAITLTLVGDYSRAIRELEVILSQSYMWSISPAQLRLDPIWEPLRSESAFMALLPSGS